MARKGRDLGEVRRLFNEAREKGARTYQEISDYTGIPKGSVSSYMIKLGMAEGPSKRELKEVETQLREAIFERNARTEREISEATGIPLSSVGLYLMRTRIYQELQTLKREGEEEVFLSKRKKSNFTQRTRLEVKLSKRRICCGVGGEMDLHKSLIYAGVARANGSQISELELKYKEMDWDELEDEAGTIETFLDLTDSDEGLELRVCHSDSPSIILSGPIEVQVSN